MDSMNITSKFTTGLISKALKRVIKNKVGYNIELDIKRINVTIENGKAKLHIETDAECSTSELTKLIGF